MLAALLTNLGGEIGGHFPPITHKEEDGGGFKRRNERRRRVIEEILRSASSIAQEVSEIIQPFIIQTDSGIQEINWTPALLEIDGLERLILRYEMEREDEEILMILH